MGLGELMGVHVGVYGSIVWFTDDDEASRAGTYYSRRAGHRAGMQDYPTIFKTCVEILVIIVTGNVCENDGFLFHMGVR